MNGKYVNLGKAWTTHMGVLIKVLFMSKGDVAELGAGPASTPLLHWVCRSMNRRLISYENTPKYFKYAKQYESRLHRIRFVKNWGQVDTSYHRGVVFIDHHPLKERGISTIRFKDSADYIVIHDCGTGPADDFSEVWPQFKYLYTWKECTPWTSVVSNFKDLSAL